MYFDFKEIIKKKGNHDHDVNHNNNQTGERHSSALGGRFKEMKAANETQNARFNEFSRTVQQFLDLNAALQTIFA